MWKTKGGEIKMKISRNFKKMSRLADAISSAKGEAKEMISDIEDERVSLDDLEGTAKKVLKL